ncbi:uncharacterized protein LOC134267634 [Saccostrea cucullata]|uniref:uncharacterized protein LOC134267634 n=1 Tax=Saccostrea cuccullata TaxID=36930 RepID=UPI002ED47FF3
MNAEKKQEMLKELKERIGKKTGVPFTVAVIGAPGAGKSSFINTMITSITGNYRQWTKTGNFGEFDQTVTHCPTWIPRERYLSHQSLEEYNFPHFLDIAGIQDTDDEITGQVLRLLLYGRIPSDVPLKDLAEDIRQRGTWLIEKRYPETPECKKVDRIIFVASAANSNLPLKLMQAVSKVLRKKRDIPIFGVLTMKDQKKQTEQQNFEEFETLFKRTLGLSHLNYLHCTNYCDDNVNEIRERIRTHYPELDMPVLKFLIQVLDPALECTDFNRSARFSKTRLIEWWYEFAATTRGINNFHLLLIIFVTSLIAATLAHLLFRA